MKLFRNYRIRKQVEKLFRTKLGYALNLKNPRTYCEKIQWLKFNNIGKDPHTVVRADKYEVRSFVAQQGFADNLVPLYGCWKSPESIDWNALPERFVLKLNNGSGSRYRWFVTNKSSFPLAGFERAARRAMSRKYGERTGEFHYGKMLPRILAEEYLEESTGGLKDYKFYCFHGKVAFFSVESGKIEGEASRAYYAPDWTPSHVAFFDDLPEPETPFCKPANFRHMLHMAERLSQGYPHLRVDLYNVDGRVYFGELTYAPESGLTRWKPVSLDLEFGALMDVRDITH
jgi:hypothetical protein